MYKYSKRNNPNEGFLYNPLPFPAKFRFVEISPMLIFALAKFRGCEFSLWRNFAGANFRHGEISAKRNFASVDAKFRQDNSEILFDSTKIRQRFDENSWRNFVEFSREQRTKNTEFCLHFFCTVLYVIIFVEGITYFLKTSRTSASRFSSS